MRARLGLFRLTDTIGCALGATARSSATLTLWTTRPRCSPICAPRTARWRTIMRYVSPPTTSIYLSPLLSCPPFALPYPLVFVIPSCTRHLVPYTFCLRAWRRHRCRAHSISWAAPARAARSSSSPPTGATSSRRSSRRSLSFCFPFCCVISR